MPQSKTQIQQTLVEQLGLADLPPERQIPLIASMTEVVMKRILLETTKRLSDQEKKEYEQLVIAGDPQKTSDFLNEKIPDYDKMVEKIVTDFKNDIKKDLKNF